MGVLPQQGTLPHTGNWFAPWRDSAPTLGLINIDVIFPNTLPNQDDQHKPAYTTTHAPDASNLDVLDWPPKRNDEFTPLPKRRNLAGDDATSDEKRARPSVPWLSDESDGQHQIAGAGGQPPDQRSPLDKCVPPPVDPNSEPDSSGHFPRPPEEFHISEGDRDQQAPHSNIAPARTNTRRVCSTPQSRQVRPRQGRSCRTGVFCAFVLRRHRHGHAGTSHSTAHAGAASSLSRSVVLQKGGTHCQTGADALG